MVKETPGIKIIPSLLFGLVYAALFRNTYPASNAQIAPLAPKLPAITWPGIQPFSKCDPNELIILLNIDTPQKGKMPLSARLKYD